jgi:hypothetical protein
MWQAIQQVRGLGDILAVPVECWIEKVHGGAWDDEGNRVQTSAKASFSFGGNYHSWQMALIGNGIAYQEIAPGKWMKKCGKLPKKQAERKTALTARAEQLFPGVKVFKYNSDALMMLHCLKEDW